MTNSFGALIYLYNGGDQPEIRSVHSEAEVIMWSAEFHSARLEVPGQPPVWIRVKKKTTTDPEPTFDAPYDWKRARNHLQGDGDPSAPFDSFDDNPI